MITKESKSIFIAEDSMFYRTQLTDILVEAGHRVHVAKDGLEVIKAIKMNPHGVDLLILDLQMPEMDGFGVLEWLKKNGLSGRFPVLILTGVSEPADIMGRIKELGATGLITKDFTPEQLVLKVNRMLFREKINPRVAVRVPVSAPVDLSVGALSFTGFIRNISSTGAFLHTKEELIPGSMVRMRFVLPGEETVFGPSGIVKWSTKSGGKNNFFGGSGVCFTSMSDDEKDALLDFIESETKRLNLLN